MISFQINYIFWRLQHSDASKQHPQIPVDNVNKRIQPFLGWIFVAKQVLSYTDFLISITQYLGNTLLTYVDAELVSFQQ